MSVNPVLKLSQIPVQDNSRTQFEKLTNPWNTANLSLEDQGTVTAIFDQNVTKLVVSGRYPFESSSINAADVVDPHHKLKALIDEGKIIQIHGNCTVDQAQVILLDDTCHLD